MMRHLDLFSGIGGFALAASWAGIEPIQFVENNKYCQRVLAKNFPGVPIHDDIKTFKGQPNAADIISGGFPCQPFSVAGKRRGSKDDRALWPEMFRIIKEVRPTWVLGENVAGIIGMELDIVLFDLEGEDYETQAFIIPACAVDAKHKRNRVWIVANSERSGTRDKTRKTVLQRRKRTKARAKTIRQTYGETCSSRIDTTSAHVANSGCEPERTEEGRSRDKSINSQEKGQRTEKRDRSTDCSKNVANTKCERRNGRSDTETERVLQRRDAFERCRPAGTGWKSEAGVGRVAYGIPNRMDRLKGLGNAIVPQVAYQIMAAIKKSEEEYHG